MNKFHTLVAFSGVGLLALSVAACGGQTTTGDDGTEVNDAQIGQAVSSPDPSGPSAGASSAGATGDDGPGDGEMDGDKDGQKGDHADKDDDRDRGDDHGECNEDENEKHHHHRHHRFHVLDGLDGTRDHQITIASLPAALPPRLIARLHEIDTNGDGIVTKDEAKAWSHAHKRGHGAKKH